MALWGKQDAAAPSNGTTVSVTNASTAVTGSGTTFLSDIKNGDTLIINSGTVTKARVASVTSDTALVLASNFTGTTNASLAIANFKIQQQPKYVYQDSNQASGVSAITKVYGISATEIKAGGDNVVSVAISSAGARYIATDNSNTTPTVTFSGGGGSSAAASTTVASNAVSTIVLSNGGSSYTSAPTVVISKPRRTIATASVTTSTDTIAYTGHLLVAGDAVVYNNGGGTTMTSTGSVLVSGNTYYVATAGLTANAFEVKVAATTNSVVAPLISGTGGAGTFSCTSGTLAAGDRVTITGTNTGTGTITGYASGNTYKVSAVTGTSPSVTAFTLTTEAGVAIATSTTSAATFTGLTFTGETVIDITGTGNAAQYFEIQAAADQATATATLGSGSHAIMASPGWVRRTVGTGGLAGRVRYEVLVAGRSLISGDDANSLVEIETPNT